MLFLRVCLLDTACRYVAALDVYFAEGIKKTMLCRRYVETTTTGYRCVWGTLDREIDQSGMVDPSLGSLWRWSIERTLCAEGDVGGVVGCLCSRERPLLPFLRYLDSCRAFLLVMRLAQGDGDTVGKKGVVSQRKVDLGLRFG